MTEGKEGTMVFAMTPNELARAIRVFSGSGGGKPLFEHIDLEVRRDVDRTVLATRHKGQFDHYLTGYVVLRDGQPGRIATNSPERLISYVESGIFPAGELLKIKASDGWLEMQSNGQRATLATDELDTVLRAKEKTKDGKPLYSSGPYGCDVYTDPDHAAASEKVSAWIEAGYGVVVLNREDLATILIAAERLKSDYAKTVMLTIQVSGEGKVTTHAGPLSQRDPKATTVDLDLSRSSVLEGSPAHTILAQYDGLDSLLQSLKNYPDAMVSILYHPAERRTNILIVLDDSEKGPLVRLTQTFVQYSVTTKPESAAKKG